MESPVNSSKTKYESAKDLHKVGDVKNRGWPKGKKRYPKSPGAPKQPLSGYVHFLNDRREDVRKESPDMSFAEISKKLASEWSQLGQEEKLKYAERADLDKERYSQEFLEYQQTDDYKDVTYPMHLHVLSFPHSHNFNCYKSHEDFLCM